MNFYAIPGLVSVDFRNPIKMSEGHQMRYAMEIIKTTCTYFNLSYEAVCKKDRHRDIVTACQISCWLIHCKMPTLALRSTASLFGNRYLGKGGFDHSAIIHCKNTMQDLLDTNDPISDDVKTLLTMI